MATNTSVTLPLPAVAPPGPVTQADRLRSLDVLRGVALLGILLLNIPGFGLPYPFADGFQHDLHSVNFWIYAVITVLFEGKMRALFSALFGAGIVLFSQRRAQAGQPVAGLFYRRMGWLVLFGLLNAHLLLWAGDVLYFYGLGGLVAFWLRKLPARYLALGVPLMALLSFATTSQFNQHLLAVHQRYEVAEAAARRHQPLTAAQQQARTEWHELASSMLPSPADMAAQTRQLKGTYGQAAHYVRAESRQLETSYLPLVLPDVLALMLLGIALFKWGFFTGQWPRGRYLRTAAWGYGLGLPGVLLYFYQHYQRAPGVAGELAYLQATSLAWGELLYQFQRIALLLGHASLLLGLFHAGVGPAGLRWLAAVGQMAFTNYLLQSVICTLFFFGYGLNYFAELKYYQLFVVVAGVWVVQLLGSTLWLRYFLFGPLEWLWRSLTYWQVQPLRQPAPMGAVA
jgi:uncharacterized protein